MILCGLTGERRARDPVLAAHIGRRRPGLLLPQNTDDLFFREPARLHGAHRAAASSDLAHGEPPMGF
jgi:hypothetical protein